MATATRLDLEAFVATEYPRVVAAVRLITGDREGAADAVHDALVALLSNPPAREPDNYAAYVTVVASNKARDYMRRMGAQQRAYRKLPVPRETSADAVAGLDVDVAAALRALPDKQRQICVMHDLMDQSVDQIARGMGVAPGTVKTQLYRARQALAAALGKEAGNE